MSRLTHVSTHGTRAPTTSWYKTPSDQWQLIYGNHVGPQNGRNVIVHFQT